MISTSRSRTKMFTTGSLSILSTFGALSLEEHVMCPRW